MEVTQAIEVAAGADQVWAILSDQFGDVATWAARMLDSTNDATLGDLGGRQVVTVEYGPASETLYRRDAENRSLGYWVEGPSLPAPISNVQTEWRVAAAGDAASTVSIRFLAVVSPAEMQPMLEDLLGAGMTPLLEELKHYAETGQPHPNVAAANEAAVAGATS